jgi:ribosomal protein L22
LAINNTSLKGKSLSEAIELLQNTDDMVTLKISRKLNKQPVEKTNSSVKKANQHQFQQNNTLRAHQAYKIPVINHQMGKNGTNDISQQQHSYSNGDESNINGSSEYNNKSLQYCMLKNKVSTR